jgi:hypothetical protein
MTNPYRSLPDNAFWRRAVQKPAVADLDPVGRFDLSLGKSTKVATAGSCFAQHIARHLRQSGYHYYVAEAGHPILPREVRDRHNYGKFSARYGNIYTARQLVQLMRRAWGEFFPAEDFWLQAEGVYLDPYRPTVQPGGFVSLAEMHADRRQHLQAVRTMFENLEVFVFTLGLTECWINAEDGAVFPLCPGVEGGVFDSERHRFMNQTVSEVMADMCEVIDRLSIINPQARVVLTVSPVPLMATAEPQAHVLSATTYSKSVLRAAAGELCARYAHVQYFPSYEIITGNYSRGRYYAADLRNVTEEGVSHVMRTFLAHISGSAALVARVDSPAPTDEQDGFISNVSAFVETECDEVLLDKE